MRISAKAEYACLAMIALAERGAGDPLVRIRDISEAGGIPETYLVQILLRLKLAGLVQSARGASGGYRLARPATAITVAEILEAVDDTGELASVERGSESPALRRLWQDVAAAERAVLRSTTLADLLPEPVARDWVI